MRSVRFGNAPSRVVDRRAIAAVDTARVRRRGSVAPLPSFIVHCNGARRLRDVLRKGPRLSGLSWKRRGRRAASVFLVGVSTIGGVHGRLHVDILLREVRFHSVHQFFLSNQVAGNWQRVDGKWASQSRTLTKWRCVNTSYRALSPKSQFRRAANGGRCLPPTNSAV